MAYLTAQKQGGGLYTTIYATVATWGDLGGGRRGAVQQRFYVGRLDGDSGLVRVTKGIAGSRRVEVDLETLRERVKAAGSVAAVETWLRGLCASGVGSVAAAAPAADAPESLPSPEPVVLLPSRDVGTALVGQAHVLGGLARSIGLDRCLAEAFGEPVGEALLHLAMHQAVRGAPLYLAEAWLDDLWLPECLAGFDFSSPGLSRLMDAVGRRETDRQSFYGAWMAERRHPRALVYDTTSISTYAADLEAAAFGHNRDGEPLPQENLALVCNRADGMPLFCRLVPGSVPDVVTLDATARMLRALGLEDTEFALDRGFYSNSNARDLLAMGHHFTLGVLLSCRQSRDILARHRAALDSPRRSICHEGRSVRHIREDWTVDMGRDRDRNRLPGRTVDAHLYFDLRRHADQTASLDEKVFAIEDKAARETFGEIGDARRWLAENARQLAPCLGADKDADGRVTVRRRPRAIAARAANFGYQLILCDTVGRDPAAVLADYRSRDRAEKLFDLLKNDDGQHRLRTGNQTVAEGRIFLAFLALVLRAETENRLRTAGLLRKITVAEFLAEVGKIRAIRLPEGDRLLREVTKRQREWIAAIGLPPVTV